jgi:hypothetical protein
MRKAAFVTNFLRLSVTFNHGVLGSSPSGLTNR